MDLVVSGILNFLTEQEAIGKADEVQDFYRYGIEITINVKHCACIAYGSIDRAFAGKRNIFGSVYCCQGYYRRVSCRYIFQMQSADVFNIYCHSFS